MRATDSWVSAVAIVNFDLELGQSIEHLEPPEFPLTEGEKLNVCYLAFPDSNSGTYIAGSRLNDQCVR